MVWLYVLFSCATADAVLYNSLYNNSEIPNRRWIWPKYREYMDKNMFPPLRNVEEHAVPVSESKYKFLARVVFSRHRNNPHMCTAICIEDHIFITAASCALNLKVSFSTIIYGGNWLRVKAMVVPDALTRMAHDDIGFLLSYNIYRDNKDLVTWHPVSLFHKTNRTDYVFTWFYNLYFKDNHDHKVIGFSTPLIEADNYLTDKQVYLSELSVVVNFNLCPSIIPSVTTKVYNAPCYNSCGVEDFNANKDDCKSYHGVLGGAVLNTKTNELLGIATWGLGGGKPPLPVGFSVVNSDNFFKNWDCARRIKSDPIGVKPGHLQTIC